MGNNKNVIIALGVDDTALFFKENQKEVMHIMLPWLKEKGKITDKELITITKGVATLELKFEKEQTYIQDLPLSTHTKNLLLHSKIYTVNEVKEWGRNRLLGIRGFGKKRLEDLENILNRRNHFLDD